MSRLVYETECTHGNVRKHKIDNPDANVGPFEPDWLGDCPGGSRTPLDPDRVLLLYAVLGPVFRATVQDVLDALEEV